MSDEEAEDFVANADLTEYDPSDMITVVFERRMDASTVAIPDDLLAASLDRAAHLGMPLETFVRSAIERALAID